MSALAVCVCCGSETYVVNIDGICYYGCDFHTAAFSARHRAILKERESDTKGALNTGETEE